MPKLPKTSFDGRRQIDVGSPRSPQKPPNEKREEGLKSPERYKNVPSPLYFLDRVVLWIGPGITSWVETLLRKMLIPPS
jgi:hypothetical protein